MKQLQSILNDLDNKVITKHQAYNLISILFNDSKNVVPVNDDTVRRFDQ